MQPARRRIPFAEYVEIEEGANERHEWLDGTVFLMPGGTPRHAALAANVMAALGARLRGRPCRAYSSDLRVRVPATGLATYPDVSVVCGRPEIDTADPKRKSVVNPTVLVEVLSPSTQDYDRDEKRLHYQQIETACEIVLVAQDEPLVEVWRRRARPGGDLWVPAQCGPGESVTLESIGCALDVDELYADLPEA